MSIFWMIRIRIGFAFSYLFREFSFCPLVIMVYLCDLAVSCSFIKRSVYVHLAVSGYGKVIDDGQIDEMRIDELRLSCGENHEIQHRLYVFIKYGLTFTESIYNGIAVWKLDGRIFPEHPPVYPDSVAVFEPAAELGYVLIFLKA